jgi:hypothetical protein
MSQATLRAGLCLLLSAASMRAEPADCIPITSVPTTLEEPGLYCLVSNLTTSITEGEAIRILAHNVTLDLGGYILDGYTSSSTLAIGVYSRGINNVTIRNGRIRGFYFCVSLDGDSYAAGGHRIEELQVDRCTDSGIHIHGHDSVVQGNRVNGCGHRGISIAGSNHRVTDNDVAGTTSDGNSARAIIIFGERYVVENNRVLDTVNLEGDRAIGISVFGADAAVVSGNQIVNSPTGIQKSTGIEVVGSNDAIVRGNNIIRMSTGISFDSSTGSFGSNIVTGAVTPYVGGTPAMPNY